jgi:hypothetical protein
MATEVEAGHHIAVGAVAAVVTSLVASLWSQACVQVGGAVPGVVKQCRVLRGGQSKGWVARGGEVARVLQVGAVCKQLASCPACGGRVHSPHVQREGIAIESSFGA